MNKFKKSEKMKNKQSQWVIDVISDYRHKQELIWILDDVENSSNEELEFSSKKVKEDTVANKDKVEYNYLGQKIIQKQPYHQ
jgi:hypothetical protein